MSTLATLRVQERAGHDRSHEAIRIGVPLARGALSDANAIVLTGPAGESIPAQFRATAHWADGSIRWLLVDALVDVAANGDARFALQPAQAATGGAGIQVDAGAGHIRVDTSAAVFEVMTSGADRLATVSIAGEPVLDARGLKLSASDGVPLNVQLDGGRVEEQGPLRVAVRTTGSLARRGKQVARIALRFVFLRGSAAVRIECEVWNPQAAVHTGGLWDLGDAGSITLGDLSLELAPAQPANAVEWQAAPGTWTRSTASQGSLYQDSSGGERWNSPSHIDAQGKSTVTFRGYRVQEGQGNLVAQGDRAVPALRVTGRRPIVISVEKFWQNFPKALRWRDGVLGVGLFPAESTRGFELQGGERKRHAVLLGFDADEAPLLALHAPLQVSLDPAEAAATGAVGYLLPAAADRNANYLDYVNTLVEGQHSVFAKREIVDEYGWRNFGDLYADHEAVNHKGPEPFVSHYNNQYDFVYGAGMHYLRTGDARWRELMVDAARHLVDIDIYRTADDKAGFSGGLFWHTDHYQPAASCTHRTYSRKNANGPYGGGPSNEHNYTSGLLQYYYLTGDAEAADTIRTLADWVIGMDDGARTLLGLVDDGPTGQASKSRDADFHKPGRGAGNSINALLDAYAVTRQRRYLDFAEHLIERVIHPHDDVALLGLDEPETRWSYVVFLQVLGKYLDRKLEWGEKDYRFWYARAGLLQYARWMLAHEKPYKDVLHKVELPTETWPAHDIRKTHVFHVAARYAPAAERAVFSAQAKFYFDRCLADLLSFPTAYVTRPQVILCTYGVAHGYYENDPHPAELGPEPPHEFGAPQPFLTQGARLKSTLRRKLSVATREFSRLLRDRWSAALARFGA